MQSNQTQNFNLLWVYSLKLQVTRVLANDAAKLKLHVSSLG